MKLTVKSLVLGMAILLTSAMPAAAQSDVAVGFKLARWEGYTYPGFALTYSSPFRSLERARISWVGDFEWLRNGDFEENILLFQGGAKFAATGNPNFTPFGQVLLGIARDSCCGGEFSSTDLVITPGGGVDILLNEKTSFRAQIAFPMIAFEGSTEVLTQFLFAVVWRLGQ